MKHKTDWPAIFVRAVAFPAYCYIGLSLILSAYSMEFSFNILEWNVVLRTTFVSVITVTFGLVLFGFLSGNFKTKEQQNEQTKK